MNKSRNAYIRRTEESHRISHKSFTSSLLSVLLAVLLMSGLLPSLPILASDFGQDKEAVSTDDGPPVEEATEAEEPLDDPDGIEASVILDDPVPSDDPEAAEPPGTIEDEDPAVTEPEGDEPSGDDGFIEVIETDEDVDEDTDPSLISSNLPGGGIMSLQGDLVTVTFMTNLQIWKTIEVEEGAYCTDQGAPPKIDNFGVLTGYWPATAVGFRGWSTLINMPETDNPFDFASTVINSDLTLYAQYSDTFLVKYKNGEDQVVDTRRFLPTQVVVNTSVVIEPPNPNWRFAYWYVEEDYINTAVPPTQFIFGALATRDMTLVPWFSNEFYVFYVSEGSQVPYSTVIGGTPVARPVPDPTRLGYTFQHWSTTPNGPAYNFNTPVTGDNLFLYAVWTPTPGGTHYSIEYFVEVPNFTGDPGTDPDNYMFYKQVEVTSTAETVVNLTAGAGLDPITMDLIAGGTTYTVQWANFRFGESKTVLGNGTTVLNVYFSRVNFTYTFNIAATSGGTSYPSTLRFKDPNTGVEYGPTYTQTGGVGTQYSFQAKFEQSIEAVWPSSWNATIRSSNVNNPSFVYWNVDNTNATSAFVSKRFTVTTDLVPLTGSTVTLRAAWGSTNEREVNYWLERLPGETGGELRNFDGTPRWYVKSDMHSQRIWLEGILSAKTIEGASYVGGIAYDINGNQLNDSSPTALYYQYNFYYTRNVHTLSFNTMGGSYIAPRTSIMFGTDLYYNNAYIPATPPTKTVDGIAYIFRGWYLDSDYLEPIPANITMPNYDLLLFARWDSSEFTIRFYDDMSMGSYIPGADVYKGPGEFLTLAETPYPINNVPVIGKGMTDGWFVYIGNTGYTMRFSFDTPITTDLELHAGWKITGFTVTYDLNGGTGTTPVDSAEYWLGKETRVASGDGITPPQADFVFTGWDEVNTGQFYYPGMIATLSGDAYFLAHYGPIVEFTPVVYHSNYPSGPEDLVTWFVPRNTSVPLAGDTLFSYTGNHIIGWSLTPGLNNPVDYTLGFSLFVGITRIDLYAVWSFNGWTVTFDQGSFGSFTPGTDTVFTGIPMNTIWGTYFDGVTHAIPEPVPNLGYRFVGWQPALPANSSVIASDMTFVAQYKWIYTLYYDGNGATSGTMAPEPRVEGEVFNLAPNAYEKLDNAFMGWATTPTGAVAYADQASFTMPAANTTLYAVWRPVPGLIGFAKSADPDTYIPGQIGQIVNYAVTFTLPNDISDYGALRIVDEYPTSQLTYAYANIQIGSGASTPILPDAAPNGEASFTLTSAMLANMVNQTITLTLTFGIPPTATGDITNTAKWFLTPRGGSEPANPGGTATATVTAQTLQVTYDGNGAVTGNVPVDSNYYASGDTVTVLANTGNLAIPNRAFRGWAYSPTALYPDFVVSGATVTPQTFIITANTTLYAVWGVDISSAIQNFSKEATTNSYIPNTSGQTLTYNISFDVSPDVSDVASLRVTDVFTPSQIDFTGATMQIGSGASSGITADSGTPNGTLSFSFAAATVATMASQHVTITLSFDILQNATGDITNTAFWYVTPVGGTENLGGQDSFTVFARIYTVTYDPNGATSGSVPVDNNSPYVPNTLVTVLGNTGGLMKTDNVFLGWAYSNIAATPDFAVNGAVITPANFTITGNTTLYAVWQEVWKPEPGSEFMKTANQSGYVAERANRNVSYEITIKLPPDADSMSTWDKLRLTDSYLPSQLTFVNATVNYGIGASQPIIPDTGYPSGELSFSFPYAAISTYTGQWLTLTLNFQVTAGTTGTITNTGAYYITPRGGEETPDPGEDDEEVYQVIPVEDFQKTYSSNFTAVGDPISFDVSFRLPTDLRGYSGLLLVDSLPPTLSYGSASVLVNNLPAPIYVPSVSGNTVRVYFSRANLDSLAGATITLRLNTTVSSSWTSGDITNPADLYYQTDKNRVPDPNTDTPDEHTQVTVPSRGYSVTYYANGATSGTPPTDTNSPYVANATVTVLGNTGGLMLSGKYFQGWAYSNIAATPDFAVNGAVITPQTFVITADTDLFAVWGDVVPPEDFSKTAAQSGYVGDRADRTITYKIQLTLPNAAGLETWESLTLSDTFPASQLTFRGATLAYGSGAAVNATPDAGSPVGKVEFSYPVAALVPYAGQQMTLTLTFEVAAGTTGTIANTGNYSITPKDGEPPVDPPGDDEEVYEVIPVEDFMKTYSAPFAAVGDQIDFAVSFKLPNDLRGYSGLLLIDRLPNTLTYVAGSGVVSVNGIPAFGFTPTLSGNLLRVYLSRATLDLGFEGASIELAFSATVNNNWTSGDITNRAEIYYQTDKDRVPDPNTDTPDEVTEVTVPNRGFTVTYNGNGATSGTPPTDTNSPYSSGDTVTVLGNTGNLALNDNVFLGWAYLSTASVPDFAVDGATITPANFVITASTTLYAVWRPLPGLDDFMKEATNQTYIPGEVGQTLTYVISFVMPADVSDYAALRIVDYYPNNQINYTNATLQVGSGAAGPITADLGSPVGQISFSFNRAAVTTMAGLPVRLTLNFGIPQTTTGDIVNTAAWFVTPRNGTEPEDPGGEDEEIIQPRIYKVTYYANGATSGTPPFDGNSPYVANATVTVLGNTGNLMRTDSTFLGWSTNPIAATPDFAVNGATITPATFQITGDTNLFAVWNVVVPPTDFSKTAAQSGYVSDRADRTITYKIQLTLPNADGLDTWESLTLSDTFPASQLTFRGATLAYGSGAASSIMPDAGSPSGKVEFSFPVAALVPYAGQQMTLTLTFEVAAGTTGTIANTGNYIITPKGGEPPIDPPGDDEEVYEVIPVEDFMKNYNEPFAAVGDQIDFAVSFKLPNDLRGYSGLLLIDRLPNTLTYVAGSGSVRINNIPAPGFAPTLSGNLLRVYMSKANLSLGFEGATIELVFSATVNSNWTSGSITNRAEIYYQTDKDRVPDPDTDPADEVAEVTVPNRGFTVTYDGNGATSGAVPIDPNSPYTSGDTVTVLGNINNLALLNNVFLGWAYSNTAAAPDFTVNGATITPANFVITANTTLFAVWRPLPGLDDFNKAATSQSYTPGVAGQTLTYNVSFVMPTDVSDYVALRIVDVYPNSQIGFMSATRQIGSGAAVSISPDFTPFGEVSFSFNEAAIASMAGQTVTITMLFGVAPTSVGDIVNTAAWYVTPRNGTEPEDPGGEDEEIVHPNIFTVTYFPNGATSGTVPVDSNNPYAANDPVTVLGNTGNLALTGNVFLGWAYVSTNPTPDFAVDGATITPATFQITADTNLYAVWRTLPTISNFSKEATSQSYIPGVVGQTLTYNISFTVPANVSDYAALRVLDKFTTGQIIFTGATVQYGAGAATGITPDAGSPANEISFSFNQTALTDMAGQNVTLTLNFSIPESTTGDIVNNAYWFVTPRNGTEPDDPGGEDQEIIHPRIYSVTYHPNGATSGIVPFDNNSPYVANDTVTVLGNTGNLARTGFSFAGWAFYDYAIAPYFAVAGATITPPDFIITGNTNLYAVWRIAVDTGQIAKTADQYGYVTDRSDGVINYQITYQLPDAAGIATWESLRLTDTYPANQLSFTGATVAYGTGAATSIQPDSTPNGVASFSFQASALSAYASQRITLTLTFEVAPGTTGTIANTGAYYITPVDGGDPGDPGSDDEEVFQVIPVLDFAKTYSAPFTAVGDTINFEVSFTLPNDLRGYGGLLLVDRLPSTLDYVSGYVLVNGIPAPGLAPVQSGNLLSSYFSRATLSVLGLEGATITMMLTTRVNNSWVSGDITNRAEIYYQTNKVGQPNPATDTPDEVVEVTVPYQPITYTVTYDANQGMNAPTDPNSPYIDGDTVTVLGPGEMIRSDSYYFRGWAYLSTATEPDFYYNTALGTLSPATFIIHADTTLYAVWAQAVIAYAPIPDFFSVTYAPGEHGTFDEQVTLGLVLNDETPLAPIPTGEEGWAFVGWSPEPSESVQGNAVYTALWEEAVVTVTFVDDDSNTVIKAESVPYGASATAPVTPPTKIGYEFAGWDTAFANVTEDIVVTASYKQVGATAEQATAAAAGNLTALYLSLIAAAVALSGFVGIRVFLSRKRQATSA